MALLPDIPGATPIDDVSELLVKGITTRGELYPFEAVNNHEVVEKYLAGGKPSRRSAKFDLAWCRKLHQEMFGKVWGWAGRFRRHEVTIGIDAWHIEMAVDELMKNLVVWQGTFAERAAWLHHRAVQIHPFHDGNGRWSRMLANIWLKQQGQLIVRWPEQHVGQVSVIREAYLAAIKAGDVGDFTPLIAMQEKYMIEPTE